MLFSSIGLAGFAGWLLTLGWHRWADLQIDFGHQLYVPWRIAMGEVWHHDLLTYYGPLSAHFHALLFKLFGVHSDTLFLANIALSALAAVMICRAWLPAGRLTATAVTALFIGVFAFGHPRGVGNFNFVAPYSYELSHGVLLASAALALFAGGLNAVSARRWFGAGLLTGLTFLTKGEVTLALSAALLLLLIRNRGKGLPQLAAGFLLPTGAFFWYLSRQMGAADAWQGLWLQYHAMLFSRVESLPFYQKVMGTDHLGMSLALMAKALLIEGAAAGLVMFYARRSTRPAVHIALAFVAAVFAFFWRRPLLEFLTMDAWRPLPLYTAALIFRWRYRPERCAAALFALILLAKMLFNAHLHHLGFALAAPAAILCVGSLISGTRGAARGAAGFAAALVIAASVSASAGFYRMKNFPVHSHGDTLYDYSMPVFPRGAVMQETVEWIDASIRPDQTFTVLPEGVMLNYLTRRRTPCRFLYWNPTQTRLNDESEMTSSLKKSPPDYVLLAQRDAQEHGARYFGKDYGVTIARWVEPRYETVHVFGDAPFEGRGFGVRVLRRSTEQERSR